MDIPKRIGDSVAQKFVLLEYVWIDGVQGLRSKTRVMDHNDVLELIEDKTKLGCAPIWNFDGSSTQQAEGHYSEVLLQPVAAFNDPFRLGDHMLILCETLNPDGTPSRSNTRRQAAEIFHKYEYLEMWFGLECEFFLMKDAGTFTSTTPSATTECGLQSIQGQYYCGVGSMNVKDREILEHILQACLYAGVKLSGINCEVGPSQFEYQVGITHGIEAGDHMWMSRYIAERVAEIYRRQICIHPKPIGNFNGSGCHCNFSSKPMRKLDSLEYLQIIIAALEPHHDDCMKIYGSDNQLRMTGRHETSSYTKFTSGIGDRTASIRIPTGTKQYIEDRRPAANMDPYLVTAKITEIIKDAV